MLIGVHVHRRGEVGPFSLKYLKILEYNNIPYIVLDINALDFWEKIKNVTHFIFHWGGFPDHHQVGRSIMPVIEKELHIKCFPDQRTTWHHDDKIRQYFLLRAHNFPIIESFIFWEKPSAISWLKNIAKYPLVFKLKSSAGSKDVLLVTNFGSALKITRRMFKQGISLGHIPGNFKIKLKDFRFKLFLERILKSVYRFYKGRDINNFWQKEKNYVLFQKFLPGNDYDTRITIIGDRAFSFRRFNRSNDFRSSGSGKINYDADKIDKEMIKTAFRISQNMGFQSMAYDFLWDEDHNPAFCEISYTYVDVAVYNCPGYWDQDLNWFEGHYWPQYFHLVDLLKMPELKQPVFES
jgi:hypothetical protein